MNTCAGGQKDAAAGITQKDALAGSSAGQKAAHWCRQASMNEYVLARGGNKMQRRAAAWLQIGPGERAWISLDTAGL
jgi:hypothetical protein